MRKINNTLIFSLLCLVGIAQSQDWRPVRTDGTYMFSVGQEYRALRIDSTYQNGDTLELYGFHELNYNEESMCYNPYGAPWFGKEIINYPDSTIIKNRYNESLVFPMNPEGEWIFFTNATDTVKAILAEEREESILGVTDSIRVFQLHFRNMTYLPDEIWISKHYGLVKGCNFERFLLIEDEQVDLTTFTLAGASQVSNTVSNLTAFDIYNFDIGDELHIEEFYEYWDYTIYETWVRKTIKTITSKTYQPDSSSVTYNYHICSNYGEYNATKTIEFSNFWLDSLPYNMNITDDLFQTGITFQFESKFGFTAKGVGVGFEKYSDSCYHFVYVDKKKKQLLDNYFPIPYYGGNYIMGLGGPYIFFQGYFSTSSTELVYYKKGSTEWGIPYNCDDLISATDIAQTNLYDVYPNPACEYITVNYQGISPVAVFSLYDISGKTIFKEPIKPGENTFPIEYLSNGYYLGIVTVNHREIYRVKIAKE